MWRMGIRRMVGVDTSFMDPNAFAAGLVCALPLTLPFWAGKPSLAMRLFLLGFTRPRLPLHPSYRLSNRVHGPCPLHPLSACFATGRVKVAIMSMLLVAVVAPVAWFALPVRTSGPLPDDHRSELRAEERPGIGGGPHRRSGLRLRSLDAKPRTGLRPQRLYVCDGP